ncbi:hypothetical protein GFS24_00505 [Chitinophaga sp. SYP-B3965]|uniref:hypothetical protein n=1 Tax=Chitinophaga sp. SYP-B3965 TaxID=2663120 RepID=UPI001299917C|nr:hypothetical protein [Chitinophaga sp. SYP-B3965]MRG43570.1 hypothetical protein [Chitinophaga sp. SYP-B3965]
MHRLRLLFIVMVAFHANAQVPVDLSAFNKKGEAKAAVSRDQLTVTWPAGDARQGKLVFNLNREGALLRSLQLNATELARQLDPVFLLTTGKRDLVSQNGWNIFFDKTNKLPRQTFTAQQNRKKASVLSVGSRTIVRIGEISAGPFSGNIEITIYNGSPLFNVAAVMSTAVDSTAILYDAGLVSKDKVWDNIAWSDTEGRMQSATAVADSSVNLAVKYRTIIGENKQGSLAVFPAPHQYFYPLDEAFNLKFTWYGKDYRQSATGFGLGIRQDPMGDNRWVPWFNAPPNTQQRLNFFCLLDAKNATGALEAVKKFTHGDTYVPLPGYKTMSSHFHNEVVMNEILKGKPLPEDPDFMKVFRSTGINIVHLAEFHYTAHPKGPDAQRLLELKTLFDMCKQFSKDGFLLLPGEEPNEFYGGHWLNFFPKPVYWIMSRKGDAPFVETDPQYGKVYRIGNKEEMLKLLEVENGLAWTAHPRTKGSTGFPDKYRQEPFFTSDRFFGAAWKAMPADLSIDRLGIRVLDLLDDMANWGGKKHVLAEADLFTIKPENEMYAHLNVNYLQLDKLPEYEDSWQPILDAMQQGKFFVTTGEVLIPSCKLSPDHTKITMNINWTFPLNHVTIISGDGVKVYKERISLDQTKAFGQKEFTFKPDLKNRKWVRVEVWDVAVNGAFTQPIWLD